MTDAEIHDRILTALSRHATTEQATHYVTNRPATVSLPQA